MPATAAELHVTDPFDVDQNLRGGTEYMARQVANVRLALGPDIINGDDVHRMALAAFNGGYGYVREAIKEARARGLPLAWATIAAILPTITVRGRKPDHKQIVDYVQKIMPSQSVASAQDSPS